MAKNLKRYKQAYDLRTEGKTFREIGEVMGVSTERARTLNNYYFFKLHKRFYKARAEKTT